MEKVLAILVMLAVVNYSTADKFYLRGGDSTYIQVTDTMRYAEAANYCRDHFQGQLASIRTAQQLRETNQIVIQGVSLEGFSQSRDWTEMWVGGNTTTALNNVVDPDTVGCGDLVLILSSWGDPECEQAFCLYAKSPTDLPRPFLCQTQHVKFIVAMADYA